MRDVGGKNVQDRVEEILASLQKEWGLGEVLSLREGLDIMMQQPGQAEPLYQYEKGFRDSRDVEEYLRIERGSWVDPMYEEVMAEARLLTNEEQTRLLRELDERIRQEQLLSYEASKD